MALNHRDHFLVSRKRIHPALWVCLFFLVLLVTGLVTFKDYGVSWDEPAQQIIGQANYSYVFGNSDHLLNIKDRYYGPFFEMALVVAAKLLNLQTSHAIYTFRHLATFLTFWLGVLIFYLLLARQFKDWKIALLGCLFLCLSPRIYADAFYNTKDIPFLVFFLAGIATLFLFLDHPQPGFALLHGLVCAAAITVRMPAILLPIMTIFFWLLDGWLPGKRETARPNPLVYLLALIGATILFFPGIWENPIRDFTQAFIQMAHYNQWDNQVLYLGQFIDADQLPWHYLPVWIAITTPLIICVFFFIGLVWVVAQFLHKPILRYTREKRDYLIYLTYVFVPFLAIIVGRSIVYDGWRHVFFIYPGILIFAINGLQALAKTFRTRLSPRWAVTALLTLLVIGFFPVVRFMVQNHPYQNVYFNRLAGSNYAEIKTRFEMDYWGLSYLEGLKYILAADSDPVIRVCPANEAGKISALLLAPADQERLQFVESDADADFFIGNYRYHPDEYPYSDPVFSVDVAGTSLTKVFKLHK